MSHNNDEYCGPTSKPTDASLCSCAGLKWHLKHFQHAKKIAFRITEWPADEKLRELSESLIEVSCGLRKLKHLVRPPPYTPPTTFSVPRGSPGERACHVCSPSGEGRL